MIRPPLDDLYADLGVERRATQDEIAAAFRARARELHPDAHPEDATAAERFKRVSRAYVVLGDPAQRARYDAGTLPARAVATSPTRAPAPAAPRPHLTRRGARWMAWGGLGLVVLGLVSAVGVILLQRHDSDLRARGVAAVATVVDVNGARRLQFTTRAGRTIAATESIKSGEAQPPVGSKVRIHYDRNDPATIVTDTSHTGRDITLWIVAIKFLIGGSVLAVFGFRRLRHA